MVPKRGHAIYFGSPCNLCITNMCHIFRTWIPCIVNTFPIVPIVWCLRRYCKISSTKDGIQPSIDSQRPVQLLVGPSEHICNRCVHIWNSNTHAITRIYYDQAIFKPNMQLPQLRHSSNPVTLIPDHRSWCSTLWAWTPASRCSRLCSEFIRRTNTFVLMTRRQILQHCWDTNVVDVVHTVCVAKNANSRYCNKRMCWYIQVKSQHMKKCGTSCVFAPKSSDTHICPIQLFCYELI